MSTQEGSVCLGGVCLGGRWGLPKGVSVWRGGGVCLGGCLPGAGYLLSGSVHPPSVDRMTTVVVDGKSGATDLFLYLDRPSAAAFLW